MGWGFAIAGALSAAGTYYATTAGNESAEAGAAPYRSLPTPPSYTDAYMEGWERQLAETPEIAALEMEMRQRYAPQQMELASSLYKKYLPQFAKTNLKALQKVDPAFLTGRQQLFDNVSEDLSLKHDLNPDFAAQLENGIRAAQSGRGNFFGNAPATAEGLYKGDAAMKIYQQRLDNMGRFLAGPAPTDKFGQLAGTGGAALAGGMAGAVAPGSEYYEAPRNWGDLYARSAQAEHEGKLGVARTIAGAESAAASAQVNPWMAALANGAGTVTGYAANGGFSQPKAGAARTGGYGTAAAASAAAPYATDFTYSKGIGYTPKATAAI